MMLVRRLVLVVLGWVLVAAGAGGVMTATALAAGDVNTTTCPNETLPSFRAYLPDCRAYEMVSPPYKQGYPVGVDAIAADGSHVVGGSFGVFVGAVGGPQFRLSTGIEYQFARGPAGWEATPLSAANPLFRNASTWFATSADLTRSLSTMPSVPAGQDNFYVRGSDGVFSDVGPATPPADGATVEPGPEGGGPRLNNFPFEGASSDLSHLLYSIEVAEHGFVWPGDSTAEGFFNLYEYVGSGNSRPVMVGVSGTAGSTSLIGECGVEAGGPGSKYNAISASGATVFFTPGGADVRECAKPQPAVDELFARLNESQSAQLSAPSPAGCTTPECQSAPAADALFEGASRDGSKAFFTSTQQLTDQASEDSEIGDSAVRGPGSGCPEAHKSGCNLYEYDFANPVNERLVLVSGGSASPHVQGVARISQDGSHAYFVAQGALTSVPNSQGQTPLPGASNLYVFERDAQFPQGRTQFIATLAGNDERLWESEDGGRPAQATPDGRFLVFQSHAQLTPDDTSSGVLQVFEYDAQSGGLVRVSIGQHGFNDNGNSSVDSARIPLSSFGRGLGGQTPQRLALSDDGSYVVFQSSAGLTPQALNDVVIGGEGEKANNVYEYHDGEVFLIYGGQSVGLFGTSASGADVFFGTVDPLLSEDVDTQLDIYDARAGGGFAPLSSAASCLGEACQGAASAPLSILVAGSALLSGGGNLGAAAPLPVKRARSAAQIKAEQLQKALKGCRAKHDKRKRSRCEVQARKRYGAAKVTKSVKANRRAK